MIKRKRTIKQRLWMVADDLAWWWSKNKEGVLTGFMFGCVMVIIAAEFVLGLSS